MPIGEESTNSTTVTISAQALQEQIEEAREQGREEIREQVRQLIIPPAERLRESLAEQAAARESFFEEETANNTRRYFWIAVNLVNMSLGGSVCAVIASRHGASFFGAVGAGVLGGSVIPLGMSATIFGCYLACCDNRYALFSSTSNSGNATIESPEDEEHHALQQQQQDVSLLV